MTYVRGTTMWHIVRQFNGGIRTRCGRVFPLGSAISDRVSATFLCQKCRDGR
jgi:hypothetical protein